ncbi:SubName: Full=Uncharacterized protein {ECO:0000313/EMBL:CCA75312.1} [Serendipita indica DSM 11827]|uniref:Uncharacterized protein n=1 Tax=Serendipita indica (strain DSM 11827) TaxID=1109443 RepID=G4TVG9_SERID|nr:SubName: Full=Uncharacterized protein {ECO:0000313/EMBL:CCA75312.1} [Serendipita indica DSM 11827]CCA75312.1 hypothetical protein PIIN_09297 [Serendipita indica DSM 11827]
MSCAPTPTLTIYSTGWASTVSSSAYVSNEVHTVTSPVIVTFTRCEAYNTSASGTPCLSSTIVTSTSYSAVVTTTPHTSFTAVPVTFSQVVPVSTAYQECPDTPRPDTPDDATTSTTTTPRPSQSVYTSVSTHYVPTIATVTTTNSTRDDPSPSNQPQQNKSNLPAIIGGTVGGILALLGIIGLIWYILWRREQNKFLFDDEEDDHSTHLAPTLGRQKRRSANITQETKENRPYNYGVVGASPSPTASPVPHSQYSSLGGYSHRRDTSRDRLMSSPPGSPNRLDVPLPGTQRRTSHYSSGVPESIMMTATGGSTNTRTSDDARGHERATSVSLMDTANVYPPGHGGFYQQYGPMEPAQSPVGASTSPQPPQGLSPSNTMHKPPLDPSLVAATRPIPTHQALVAAAGLLGPLPPTPTTTGRTPVMASPPPGAAGARPYTEWREQGDMLSAVMSSGDQAAAGGTTAPNNGAVGFGRQMSPEKSPRRELVRSPVIQHQDGGRVPDNAPTTEPANEAPPAYSQS